jgi:penicillin-binding protein 1B
MNLATVRLGLDIGLPKVADALQRLGLQTAPAQNPSMLLGTVEMTPLDVVQMYTSLANGGFRARMRAVRAVLDERGKPLKSFKVQVEQAAPAAAVYQLDRMLTLVTTRGTARSAAARLPAGTVVAGKTGTSSDTRDSWFAGFTGSYLAVVWVGYDDNRVTGLTGALGALPIWLDTVAKLQATSFDPVPPELVEDRWIEFGDGLETTPACSADAVDVSVPLDTQLPAKAGCRIASSASSPGRTSPTRTSPRTMGDRIKAWVKHIVH